LWSFQDHDNKSKVADVDKKGDKKDEKAGKKFSDFGKVAVALYKIKLGDTKELDILVDFSLNDKDKAKNIINYIRDSTKMFDLDSFKVMIQIQPKNHKSSVMDDIKILFTKITNGTVGGKNLFSLLDALGDGSRGINPDEF